MSVTQDEVEGLRGLLKEATAILLKMGELDCWIAKECGADKFLEKMGVKTDWTETLDAAVHLLHRDEPCP